jgi:hypothetical protein
MVIPPTEIRAFEALEDETFILTIVGGNYSPTRHYYNVDEKSYVVTAAGALRRAQGQA